MVHITALQSLSFRLSQSPSWFFHVLGTFPVPGTTGLRAFFVPYLGLKKGKEETRYYLKARVLAQPTAEGAPRPRPRLGLLWKQGPQAPAPGVQGTLLSSLGVGQSLGVGTPAAGSPPTSLPLRGLFQLWSPIKVAQGAETKSPKGIRDTVRKRKYILGRPQCPLSKAAVVWQRSQLLDSSQKWTGRQQHDF